MAIVNLMEEIVFNSIKEVIKNDKDLDESSTNIFDICAYVLNRIPSKYSTGERGFLHGTIESKFIHQQRVDILFLIYEAIDIIKTRRSDKKDDDSDIKIDKNIILPHIIGEVLEETTYTPIPDVSVNLKYNGKTVEMLDRNWINPYITNAATRGYFHFWPDLPEGELKGNKISFELTLLHSDMVEKKIDIIIEINKTDKNIKSHNLPLILMTVKEGVTAEFLNN